MRATISSIHEAAKAASSMHVTSSDSSDEIHKVVSAGIIPDLDIEELTPIGKSSTKGIGQRGIRCGTNVVAIR